MVIIRYIALVMLLFFSFEVRAQGCSDAGFCTVPELKPKEEAQAGNTLSAGAAYGLGDEDVTVWTPYVSYSHRLSDKFSASAKVTYSSASGELGDHADFGDLFVDGSYLFHRSEETRWTMTAGVKIPLSKADAGDGNRSLPMDYQSTLETTDLLLAVSGSYKQFGFMLGLQQPLTGENSNSFLQSHANSTDAQRYASTNEFTRNGDVLARVSYSLKFSQSGWSLTPSLLPIYHLGEDTYQDGVVMRARSIVGSDGLTLNGNIIGTYIFPSGNSVELSLAAPFVTRDARPDGLTRSLVMGVEYRVVF